MAVPIESAGEITSHLTTAAAITYSLQWLKDSGWFPWLSQDTKVLNRVLSAFFAALAAGGINWAYDASVDGGTLVIHGITWMAVLHALWEWFKQFTTQQVIYDGVVQKAGKPLP